MRDVFQGLLLLAVAVVLAFLLPVGDLEAALASGGSAKMREASVARGDCAFVILSPEALASALAKSRISLQRRTSLSEPRGTVDYDILREPLPERPVFSVGAEAEAEIRLPPAQPSYGAFSVTYPQRTISVVGPDTSSEAREAAARKTLLDLSGYASMKEKL